MPQKMLTLKQFMLRQQVLQLYRRMFRLVQQVPDKNHRTELQDWIRTDFRNNAHHTDEITIKMLMKHGERSMKELENTIALSK